MTDSLSFFRGKRVLVTGHTGFKGAWLTIWLEHLGAEVHGIALAPEDEPSMFELCGVAALCASSTVADIREPRTMTAAMERVRPEVVLHLAAQSLVRRGYRDPVETWDTNVLGTLRVLEACRTAPDLRAVVCVTTDKCYENAEDGRAHVETDRLGGRDPYSASKAACEMLVASHRQSFFGGDDRANLATARAGNVIGGGDWAEDRLIPDIVRAVRAGEPARLRNPAATRPWQHVLDPLHGYLQLARALWEDANASEAWNFGPDGAETVDVVARRLCHVMGRGEIEHVGPADAPHEAAALQLDSGKARERLGWRPHFGLEAAIDRTAEWYGRWLAGSSDLLALTREQISTVGGTTTP